MLSLSQKLRLASKILAIKAEIHEVPSTSLTSEEFKAANLLREAHDLLIGEAK